MKEVAISDAIEKTVAGEVYEEIAEEYAAIIDAKDANVFYEKPAMLGMMPNVSGLRVRDAVPGYIRNGFLIMVPVWWRLIAAKK